MKELLKLIVVGIFLVLSIAANFGPPLFMLYLLIFHTKHFFIVAGTIMGAMLVGGAVLHGLGWLAEKFSRK